MVSLFARAEAILALFALFLSRANCAVIVQGNADTQEIGDRQRSRFVRREFAETPHKATKLSPKGRAIENAKKTAVEAAGLKSATEVEMAKTITTVKAKAREADDKRLVAEAVIEVLETNKAKAEHAKADKAQTDHKPKAKSAAAHKTLENDHAIKLLSDEAKQKAKDAERIKLQSLHKAIRSRMVLGAEDSKSKDQHVKAPSEHHPQEEREAEVSGLPEVAFSSEAFFVDRDVHFANLMKVISQRTKVTSESQESEGDVWCDKDYPLGIWNTSECSSDAATSHMIIESEAMCAQAAKQANATPGDGDNRYFRIPAEWGHLHPKGCFMFPCHWDPGHVCYWYNAIEVTPDYPWGAPVCQRPLFRNGTADTNGGCPNGYDVIMNENNCTEAGYCVALCEQTNYLVGIGYPIHNASTHDLYPEGCFIHAEQGCVYYNYPYGQNPPQNPVGIPLCNVTQITHFPEVPLPEDIFW